MTAEDIFLECKAKEIKVSVATVYRNLASMAEQGLIRKISVTGQPDHYDRNMCRHEHIMCEVCGKLRDVRVEGLEELLENSVGVKLNSYDLCMRYICPECMSKAKQ
jgi:Fur family ferric uptake transcriptional regulator/Fur family peroxide stress response transcriptional regulator